MLKRLIDLVMQLTEQYEKCEGSLSDAGKKMVSRGYSQQEVDQAIEWISAKRDIGQRKPGIMRKSGLRIMSAWEKMKLDDEAQGYIVKLMNLGIIDEFMLDRIIAHATSLSFKGRNVEDVKEIASSVILNTDPGESDWPGLEGMEDGETVN